MKRPAPFRVWLAVGAVVRAQRGTNKRKAVAYAQPRNGAGRFEKPVEAA